MSEFKAATKEPSAFTQTHLNVSVKLEYLDRLTKLIATVKTPVSLKDFDDRIEKVCTSIEQDLGIKPADYDVPGKITVPFTIDAETATAIQKAYASKGGFIKADDATFIGDKDTETIVPLKQFLDIGEKLGTLSDKIVKSVRESMDKLYYKHAVMGKSPITAAVTGMYKREWTSRCPNCNVAEGYPHSSGCPRKFDIDGGIKIGRQPNDDVYKKPNE